VRAGRKVWTSHNRPVFLGKTLRSGSDGWNLLLASGRDNVLILADSGGSKSSAPCVAEKKSFSPPSLPGNSDVVLLRWAPEAKRRCGEDVERLSGERRCWVPRQHNWAGRPAGRFEYVGSVRYTRRVSRRSM